MVKIKCSQHNMIIRTSTGKLSSGKTIVYHERHGSPCESQTFTVIEEHPVGRGEAEAWLIRLRLEAEHRAAG